MLTKRRTLRLGLVLVCLAAGSQLTQEVHGQDTRSLVQVIPRAGATNVGQLGRENATHIEILDIDTQKPMIYLKSDLLRVNKNLTDDSAVQALGLAELVSWRVSAFAPKGKPVGALARVDGAILFVALGSNQGVEKGDLLNVFRGDSELKDPITGEVLGTQRRRIAQLEVTEVQEKFCKAKQLGDLEIALAVGDLVEPATFADSIAIFPPLTANGDNTEAGVQIAESLTTALVNRKLPVVERRLLADTLTELAIEQTELFDSASAQKVGKLTGAFAILTGTLTVDNRKARVNLRLVEVESGKVLWASTVSVSGVPLDLLETAVAPKGGSSSSLPHGKAASGKAATATAFKGAKWLSKDASYTVSSRYENIRPLESLLNESDLLYASERGVSGGKIIDDGYYAFTTNNGPGEHVQIDLGRECVVRGVYIKNKLETEAAVARAKELTIWLSVEVGVDGHKVWTADEAKVEWAVVLNRPTKARYVKIGFPKSKSEYLHLTKVKIFGTE